MKAKRLFSAAAAIVLGYVLPAAAQDVPASFKGTGTLIVNNWGGPTVEKMHKAWYGDFTGATGIALSATSIPDVSKLKIMAQVNNVEWDVVDFEGNQMLMATKNNLLEPIDYDLLFSLVPKDQLDPAMLSKYGVGSTAFSTVIAWNKEVFPKGGPKDWVEFFDTQKFPGRRALYANPKPALEIALMASGKKAGELYPMNIDEAFKALDAIGPKVNLWVEKTSQWDVLIQNKEVDLMGASLARTMAQIAAGEPYAVTFNQSIVEQSFWTIPKGAPNAKEAQKLVAWMMRKEGAKKALELLPYYGMTNVAVYKELTPELISKLPGSPQNAKNTHKIDAQWWLDNEQVVRTRWLDWLSKR
ncbi:ABC transporter substrate-binding protein [Neorhizobium galegae]|uniref:ABC transporter substrate-binding protein n=1 Tax=Neorhizobium galegae TaxID=399 RepID=UPI00062242D1|nr:ABC transporter substrate-binding protein [Neorhizobium galegae]CDZ60098.1 Polyamine ABC transporter, periplasmic polyamine-binding protein [Neorhizobium galegae bv. orientalis]KAB1121037.1 ABC transporter substrate-binding protein [Neorhizobium galegae]MCQ1574598.1 ABC transporter substrate-binding protein [Neorhizobium galegae]MCQ1808978.1 ABC transporter substrate-binding protein [Neorhizobium galegae]UIK08185.1 ABC transporter substrate-binding protein [Neorhizobium galegae]